MLRLCRTLMLVAVLAAAWPVDAAAQAQDEPAAVPRPPNIVFILTDDQRWDTIGVAGNPNIFTPHIDQLAAEGVYFPNAVTHVPLCCPSRVTLLTGLAVHQHGYVTNGTSISTETELGSPTVPAMLRSRGYNTVLIGKWHIKTSPWRCGFSDIRSWLQAGAAEYQDYELSSGRSRGLVHREGWMTEILFDDAIDFLENDSSKQKPFLIWLSLFAPHLPMSPNPDRMNALYAGKTSGQLRPATFTEEPCDFAALWDERGFDKERYDWAGYYAAISHVDEQLGRLRGVLEEQGLADNTVVIFASDHGFMMGNRGWYDKSLPYFDSLQIPMIIHAPMLQTEALVSDAPVSTLDLPPTFLSLAGIDVPSHWLGTDLTPLLRGDESKAPTMAVSEFNLGARYRPPYRAIRNRTHKLILFGLGLQAVDKKPELYDLTTDPHELENLFESASARSIRAELEVGLRDWVDRSRDPALDWLARLDR